jgi:hypothetical protein
MDALIIGMAVRGTTIYYCTLNKGLKMLNLYIEIKTFTRVSTQKINPISNALTCNKKIGWINSFTPFLEITEH